MRCLRFAFFLIACVAVTACTSTRPAVKPSATTAEPKGATAKIYILIDDAGAKNTVGKMDRFVAFEYPLTFAVLPSLPHTEAAYKQIAAVDRHEIILHQPMEPTNGYDPGPAAITLAMKPEEIRKTLDDNLVQMPKALGLNNHMGSAITSDTESMRTILEHCLKKNRFFVDSLTTPNTVVGDVSAKLQLKYFARDVFLDNKAEKAAVEKQFRRGLKIADEHGAVIMIGHAWSSATADVLYELAPKLVKDGYEFRSISKLYLE